MIDQQFDCSFVGTFESSKRETNKGGGMALTDTFVKNTKPNGKPTGEKHTDGLRLYLHVKDAGKYWRLSYRFDGKQKTLALGVYRQRPDALAIKK